MPACTVKTPRRALIYLERALLISTMSVLLAACGGGGGSGSTGSTAGSGSSTSGSGTSGAGTSGSGSGTPAPTSPTGSGAPSITSFAATPTVIGAGQSTMLTWAVSNSSSLTISPAIGSVTGTSVTVTPTATTTYTLTAAGTGGQTKATATVTIGAVATHYAAMAGADLGIGANLNGAIPFPADNAWNTDISQAAVDPNSSNLISSIGLNTGLHPDFGSGTYSGGVIGIPYVVVSSAQTPVPVTITAYASQSDPGPFPVPDNAPIEGEPVGAASGGPGGDMHVLVIDRDTNRLYEMWQSSPASYLTSGTAWSASSAALFHLDSDNVRPTAGADWTSADAAGLPIFPGLVRYEEAHNGVIPHALRFTVNKTRAAYLPPADHYASSDTSTNVPPMGMRVRLKASYVIPSSFSPEVKAILQAMKTYGMIVADNGSSWYVSGAPDSRWDDNALSALSQVTGSDFEVVLMTGIVTGN